MNNPESLATLLPTLKEMVFDRLSDKLTYHNFEHTQQVVAFALKLAKATCLTTDDERLLYAAAVLHDSGYGKKYNSNEGVAAMLARKLLPDFGFSEEEIAQICDIILATNLVMSPNNTLEMLMSDADMGYLGSKDFLLWSNKLFHEWKAMNGYPELTDNWLQSQINFLEAHCYFTKEAIALFEAGKQRNLNLLKTLDKWPF